jgi:RNA polymerase sigma-70 factor (ECF subfamily)
MAEWSSCLKEFQMDDSGPPQIFDPNVLVDDYGDYLFRCALLYVRDRSLAEDLVQETFLAALQCHRTFTGGSSLRTWLLAILKHKAVDHFRRIRRHMQLNGNGETWIEEASDDVARAGPSNADPVARARRSDPQVKIDQNAFWGALAKGLAELSPRTATAFALREIEQLSAKEVCQRMQISESNLWVMLHRARLHLRECLELNGLR